MKPSPTSKRAATEPPAAQPPQTKRQRSNSSSELEAERKRIEAYSSYPLLTEVDESHRNITSSGYVMIEDESDIWAPHKTSAAPSANMQHLQQPQYKKITFTGFKGTTN